MKKFWIVMLVFFFVNVSSQEKFKKEEVNDYLQKSLRQRKTGNILAISGGALFITGLVVAGTDDNKFLLSSQQWTGVGISALGVLTALSAVPFIISSNQNEKKSVKLISKMQSVYGKDYISAGFRLDF